MGGLLNSKVFLRALEKAFHEGVYHFTQQNPILTWGASEVLIKDSLSSLLLIMEIPNPRLISGSPTSKKKKKKEVSFLRNATWHLGVLR